LLCCKNITTFKAEVYHFFILNDFLPSRFIMQRQL